MYSIEIKDEAVSEISEAYDYLENEQKGLGERLLLTIENCIELIRWNPYLFQDDYKDIKKVRLSPFRYLIRYKIYGRRIVIIQLFHGNLHPEKKRK